MKKTILALAVGLWASVAAFADDHAALGLGILSESSQNNAVYGGGIRAELFIDAGTQLYGPFNYGFELQGDIKKLDQTSSAFSVTDVSTYFINTNNIVEFVNTTDYTQTYTLWDADISPRAYISYDLGNTMQVLGFLGLNYNWQTLDYELKTDDGTDFQKPDGTIGNDYKESHTFGDNWSLLMGLRVSLGFVYVDYTRFLQANDTGGYAWNQYNKDRLGLGLSLRF